MKKIQGEKAYKNKEIIIFDLDGTLTESKSDMKADVGQALKELLEKKKVAVIGGGNYKQFRKQFVEKLKCPPDLLGGLWLFPTTAASCYEYKKGWKKVYEFKLSKEEKTKIKNAFKTVLKEINYVPPPKTYGKVFEDRGTQFTFSALGQDIVAVLGKEGLRLKEKWKRENTPLKMKIARLMQKKLPDFAVHPSAFTSVDITKKGIDKAYGVRMIEKTLKTPISKMVFIGDALYKGGNDAAAKKTGIKCVAVKGPEDTKKEIQKILDAGK